MPDKSKVLNVAVIGAGAAGLCAARHIATRPNMKPIVYEQSNSVGGAWCYTEETKLDKFGLKVHSAMYKNLRTNLPKEVMEFPEFPFDEKLPSFMTREQVQSYLNSYCDNFDLQKYIRFETQVQHVIPVSTLNGTIWEITVQNVRDKTITKNEFHCVFVCNGHYAQPHIPTIPGQEDFKGLVMHSHSYRHPEMFTGKRVVVLGCRSSGQDISLDISKCAKSVIISHRTERLLSPLPDNVSQVPTISHFHADRKTISFEDESEVEADAFMYCTGYKYSFPFLDESCNITVDSGRIKYLYNHVVNPYHDTMSFIGFCMTIVPFPQFDFQVLYGLAAMDGSMKLPSTSDMLKDIEEDYQNRLKEGMFHRAAHTMGPKQWAYNNKLADAVGVPRLNLRVEKLFDDVGETRDAMLCTYKDTEIKLLDNGFYELQADVQDDQMSSLT